MGGKEKALKACPALGGFLEKADSETRHHFEWLVENGMEGVFIKYLAGAGEAAVGAFFGEFSRTDHQQLLRHRELLACPEKARMGAGDLGPVEICTVEAQAPGAQADSDAGREAISAGRVAAVAFAGGAATRFRDGLESVQGALPSLPERLREGVDPAAPKGCFPIGPVEGLTFYEKYLAEAFETGIRYGRLPHCLVMTSGVTASATRRWLESASVWGIPKAAVTVFGQNENPRLDDDGDIVAARNGRLQWTGDGHGGVYAALAQRRADGSTILKELLAAGVGHLVMFNIDNPAARPFFAARIGRHVRTGAAFTMSTVRKTEWSEKIGVAAIRADTGRVEVVEYNVLDEELAKATGASGGLLLSAGNINVNLIDVRQLRYDLEPTIYRAKTIELDGAKVSTSSMEFLNQHITRLLLTKDVLFHEVERRDFFMPTKNPTGGDSVVTSFHALADMYARWIEQDGGRVPRPDGKVAAWIELHPSVAMEPGDLAAKGIGKGWVFDQGSRVYLCARYAPGGDTIIAGSEAGFGRDCTFIVRVEKPYGDVVYHSETGELKPEPHTAGKFMMGKGVAVRPGVRVEITVEGDGECMIHGGKVFTGDLKLVVKPGQKVTL
jgi:UDP-N-acetylglucosamine/UDP-N-acetylgalactosamine diphosphorylase